MQPPHASWIIIIEPGAITRFLPAWAITLAICAAMPSTVVVTSALVVADGRLAMAIAVEARRRRRVDVHVQVALDARDLAENSWRSAASPNHPPSPMSSYTSTRVVPPRGDADLHGPGALNGPLPFRG